MKFDWRLLTVLILALGLMWGCESTDEDDDIVEFDVLTEYMAAQAMDVTDVISGWIIGAGDVVGNEDDYYIIDIRAADGYYNDAHLPGAVNSSGADILTAAEGNTEGLPILVVCYSGQSAGHAVVALRLSGYTDAKVLKFGMSSWGPTWSGSWDNNIGNRADGHANWTDAASPAYPGPFDDPELTTGETEGAAILAARVDAMLEGWFKGVSAVTDAGDGVLDVPANFNIINYWPLTDSGIGGENPYTYYGHINGAVQIPPGDITIADDGLNVIDPDAVTVVYCWTGQTSSMMTAYLNVLGYDVKSLKFGVNGLIYDDLMSHKWSTPDADKTVEP